MSIAPFLPGLPVPSAADGGQSPDASGGDPGAAASAFGDALAAALAGTLAVAPAPAPAPAPVPSSPSELPVIPVELPVIRVDLPVSPAESALPTPGSGVATAESGVATTESGVPTTDVGVATTDPGVAAPAPRRTTEGTAASALTAALVPAETGEPVAVSSGSTRETANSNDQTANSTVETGNSTEQTGNSADRIGNSAVGTPHSAVGTPPSAVTKAVVQQVFPEVTRIVSTVGQPGGPGNGTHRITLTLQPEQLGEVRVTLVVRDGAVHVRLAGAEGADGAAVHRALAGEAPELQRILERSGAEARVTVRDPFAPLLPSTTPSPQAGPDTDARSGAQPRQERQDGQDGRAAREQPREQPRRQEPQRASYPTEPIPVAGRLDRTV